MHGRDQLKDQNSRSPLFPLRETAAILQKQKLESNDKSAVGASTERMVSVRRRKGEIPTETAEGYNVTTVPS